MKIIKYQELISLLATVYAMFLLGKQGINSNPYVYAGVGVAVSIFMYRVVFDRLKAGRKSGLIMLMSLPFVASWILVSPSLYTWFLGATKGVNQSNIQAQINKNNIEIDRLNSKIDHTKDIYFNFKSKKLEYIKAKEDELKPLREEYFKLKSWKNRVAHPYYRYTKFRGVGSGSEAIHNIAVKLFEDKLKTLSPAAIEQELKARVLSLQAKNKTLSSQIKANIPLSSFYVIMAIVGVIIELFITHIDYWVQPSKDYTRIEFSDTMDIELLENPQQFLEALGVEKPTREIALIYAMFVSKAKWGLVKKDLVKQCIEFKNPRTRKPYKVTDYFYTVRKKFEENGGNFSLGLTMNLQSIKNTI